MSNPQGDLDSLYEVLARYSLLQRRFSKHADGNGLELRKRLLPPSGDGPADNAAGLDRWLQRQAPLPANARVLDLGCGFGASLFRWVEATGSSGVGVTRSRVQATRAAKESVRRKLGARCTFLVQDFATPLAEQFDTVLAIESLAHASDLPAVLRNVHHALRPGGHFLWLDDGTTKTTSDDPNIVALSHPWHSPSLQAIAMRRVALENAGLLLLNEIDLTSQVVSRPMQVLARHQRRLQRLRRFVPIAMVRHLADAFLGGIALEQLYASGVACYRVPVAQQPVVIP